MKKNTFTLTDTKTYELKTEVSVDSGLSETTISIKFILEGQSETVYLDLSSDGSFSVSDIKVYSIGEAVQEIAHKLKLMLNCR